MKKIIYISDFKVGPEATKKQNKLFEADLEFAISEGYKYIKSADERVFKIVSRDNLVEVDETEESLKEQSFNKPEEVEFDPNEEESRFFKSNHSLIEDIKSFMEDVKIAFERGFRVIEDVDGFGFKIINPNFIKAVYGPDETTAAAEDIGSNLGSSLGAGAKSCINCESMTLIDGHINKILKQEHLSEHDVNVMLKLTALSEHLGGH